MNRADVITALIRAGMFSGPWELDDDVYEPISTAFVVQAWAAWVQSLPPVLQKRIDIGGGNMMTVPNYVPECFDCDNISGQFACFVDLCMARDAVINSKPRGNSAIGRFNFSLGGNPAIRHSRNWFIDYDGNVHVFDAGDCSTPSLTALEKPTISFGESV